jgi:hypothetical protein
MHGGLRNAYSSLVRKPEENEISGRTLCSWEIILNESWRNRAWTGFVSAGISGGLLRTI